MADLLDREVDTYQAHKAELLGQSPGKFVLIKGNEVVGVFDTKMDAIRQGYERFGNVPFMVKHIVEVEAPQNFTSNLLAV